MKIEVSKRVKALGNFRQAMKYLMTKWLADSVKELKQSASTLRKTGNRKKGGKTAQLSRNIDFTLNLHGEKFDGAVGTGVGRAKNVVYAYVQDKGGTIRKKNKMLTIPLGDTKGYISYYPDGFFIRSKKGNVLYCQRKGKNLVPLFVLKDEVEIPATNWFSSVMNRRRGEIEKMLSPENIFETALKLTTR